MKPLRTSRRGSALNVAGKRAVVSSYPCAAFSYHLAKADPLANDVLVLADKVLKMNVLSWIEVIAQTKNLIPLIRATKNFRTYLDSCAAERSPLDRSMQMIRGWTTDFIRVVAKSADAISTLPSAIYWLVLPFCPTESTIYRIANPGRRLSIVGLSNAQWDDRLSCIDFHDGQTSAIRHGDEFFAVGLTTGTVALYHVTSCQKYKNSTSWRSCKDPSVQRQDGTDGILRDEDDPDLGHLQWRNNSQLPSPTTVSRSRIRQELFDSRVFQKLSSIMGSGQRKCPAT